MSRWQLDPVHSSVQFSARHMMVSNVRGVFRDFSLDVDFDPEHPADGRVEAVIQAASIDTGAAARDAHLRSADFLDAERFPTLTFRSTTVEPRSGDEYRLHGELTNRGETRPVVLEAEYLGVAHNLQGGTSAGFSAHTKLSRKEWGLTWNMGLEAGGLVVGDEIRVDIDLELLSPVPEQAAPEVEARTGVA
jgi:polyisoprenoid-binding protein YceI